MAEVLNAQLGAWVQGLDAEALKIGVWSGQIVLENLQASATSRPRVRGSCAPGALKAMSGNARGAPAALPAPWSLPRAFRFRRARLTARCRATAAA